MNVWKKKPKITVDKEINRVTWEWFGKAKSEPIVKEKAFEITRNLGNNHFKGSNRWLCNFRDRYQLARNKIPKKVGDAGGPAVNDCKRQLATNTRRYVSGDHLRWR